MSQLAEAVTLRLEHLKKTQWISPEHLKEFQHQQLKLLLEYCERQSPYFAERLKTANLTSDQVSTPSGLTKLPPLTRRHLQEAGKAFYCKETPKNHGAIYKTKTSGSTGEPVVVQKTGLNQLNWLATNLLDHLWHTRDFKERLCAIRPNIQTYTKQENWGPPAHLLYKTGNSLGLPITADIGQLAEWISEFQPHNLLIYPSILKALTEYCVKHSSTFIKLGHIRTLGETLSDETRRRAATTFKAKMEDTYSSQEVGTIALECPMSGLYHIMEENLIVEVLNEEGQPCAPGEIGRIVITDLHNFSTPLIRYDIGDYAEVGEPCPCGRGLSALKNIRGRERNLLIKPDGSRHWPLTNFGNFRDIAPIQQYQMIQEDLRIEVRLVAERALTAYEEDKLKQTIQEALGYPFELIFTYFDKQIPLSSNGKFEEFICRARS
jgi:phenylacetate-CoA ligase